MGRMNHADRYVFNFHYPISPPGKAPVDKIILVKQKNTSEQRKKQRKSNY
jgi:hypothetical protein